MDISSTFTLPADPLAVFTLFTDRDFLEEVAKESGATSCQVGVAASTTTSTRELPAPEQARSFTGPSLTIVEEVSWGDAAADGARTGRLELTVKGQPVTMPGHIRLAPAGADQTEVTVDGDLKARIPLMGKKIEKMAAPAILSGIKVQESVALRHLSR